MKENKEKEIQKKERERRIKEERNRRIKRNEIIDTHNKNSQQQQQEKGINPITAKP